MARVPYLQREEIAEPFRYLLDERPINLVRAVAHCPDGLEQFQNTGKWILSKTTLNPRLREMAIIRVGYLLGNDYEYSHHLQLSETAAVSDRDRHAVGDPAAYDDELDQVTKLVLRATDEITLNCVLKDETWAPLVRSLGTRTAVELVLTIANCNAVSRVLGALEVDVEPEYMPFLERFPLPR